MLFDITIGKYKFRGEILLLILIVYLIITTTTLCSCSKVSSTEGFALVKNFVNESSNYELDSPPINTKSWFTPDLTYTAGNEQQQNEGVAAINNRQEQPIPLPEGEMALFATTDFKPECCPNTYSTGSGCACMTTKQYDYLIGRGGNNEPSTTN